jgi:hypothetical protein
MTLYVSICELLMYITRYKQPLKMTDLYVEQCDQVC